MGWLNENQKQSGMTSNVKYFYKFLMIITRNDNLMPSPNGVRKEARPPKGSLLFPVVCNICGKDF